MPGTNGSSPELSIVIPCLNERENAQVLVDSIGRLQDRVSTPFEVIFVDGGSKDGTAEAIEERAGALRLTNVIVERGGQRRGYGADIKLGLARARGAILAWTHADLQCDPGDVFEALETFRQSGRTDVVVKGSRKGRPAFDKLFTFGMQALNYLVAGHYIDDINAQPKLFPRSLLPALLGPDAPDDFSLDLFALNASREMGYHLLSVPVHMRPRVHGEAKGGGGALRTKIRLSRRTAAYILSLSRSK